MQTNTPKKNWQQPDLILISTNDTIRGGGAVHTIKEISIKSGRSFFISTSHGAPVVVNKITFYNAS